MATAPFSKTPRSCEVLFSWRHDGQDHRDKQTTKFTTVKCRIFCFVFSETAGRHNWSGADPGFLLGGGALVCCSTSTPITHIVFFWQNTSCIRKPQVISGGDKHPLHPPPRSAPACSGQRERKSVWQGFQYKSNICELVSGKLSKCSYIYTVKRSL